MKSKKQKTTMPPMAIFMTSKNRTTVIMRWCVLTILLGIVSLFIFAYALYGGFSQFLLEMKPFPGQYDSEISAGREKFMSIINELDQQLGINSSQKAVFDSGVVGKDTCNKGEHEGPVHLFNENAGYAYICTLAGKRIYGYDKPICEIASQLVLNGYAFNLNTDCSNEVPGIEANDSPGIYYYTPEIDTRSFDYIFDYELSTDPGFFRADTVDFNNCGTDWNLVSCSKLNESFNLANSVANSGTHITSYLQIDLRSTYYTK